MTRKLRNGQVISPQLGRFYPRGLLDGAVAHVYPEDRRPVRVVDVDGERVAVDLNHPLAGHDLQVAARLLEWQDAKEEHGGRCNDIVQDSSAEGPGLQGALAEGDTAFYGDDPFARGDARPDAAFYEAPRLVDHIDAQAQQHVRNIYSRFLRPGMRVLDAMSSWNSHLPVDVPDLRVSGLGMNADELAANPRLAEWMVHDLNRDPHLPYGDASFDAAVCTVSVEYLTQPVEVLTEMARVLRPGAPFVVTFSERWFPPKVVRVWTELHSFERMALVVDYFRRSGRFEDLATESVRGWPRPADDKYFPQLLLSDAIYAVAGRRRAD
jgi:SAM-dependent methyltransferase